MRAMDTSCYRFGQYRLLPTQRRLLSGEQLVKLGSRAFDMLLALLERRDRVVTKHELMELVWPKLVVEENNLQVQVLALRKLLGHGAIATVPGRGYRFTLPVEGDAVPSSQATPAEPPNAPRLFGRDDDLRALRELILAHPLVTVAGAGGIGKTRLAQSAAHSLAAERADGVWWVELAGLSDAALVPAAVSQAMGVQLDGGSDPTAEVARALQGKAALLVLDNAEHLIEGVAAFVAALRERASSVKLLVTSQAALHGREEQVFRPGPLALPRRDDLAGLQASGAVALFVARAQQADPRFKLTDENGAAVADICRRLDGIPLAIELAAARLPLLGIEGLRRRLDERFRVLTAGARAVMRRHQTLRAALEWSHGLLQPEERVVLRRLGVFAGGFTLEAAQSVAADEYIDGWDVLEHLGALVDKSLVVAEGEALPRYRLLETTRLYALERLAEAGETEGVLGKHAGYFLSMLEAFDKDPEQPGSAAPGLRQLDDERDNLMHALDWCAGAADDEAVRTGLRMVAALRFFWSSRPLAGVAAAVTQRALDRARHLPGDAVRCRALSVLVQVLDSQGQSAAAEAANDELAELAQSIEDEIAIALAAVNGGFLASGRGDLDRAHRCFVSARAKATAIDHIDLACSAISGLADICRRRGEADEAARLAEELVAMRRAGSDGFDLAQALMRRCDIAISARDAVVAEASLREALPMAAASGSANIMAVCVELTASLQALREQWEDAARLHAAAARWRRAHGYVLHADDSAQFDSETGSARDALGAAAYEAESTAGSSLTLYEAFAQVRVLLAA